MKATIRIIIPLALVCFALAPRLDAACQEGCDTFGNTFLGDDALINDTGTFNTAIGQLALQNMDSTATGNTAVGAQALKSDTNGLLNTAVGGSAMSFNTSGGGNVAVGSIALLYNTTGNGNVAVGSAALLYNTTGYGNIAIGGDTLSDNRTGSSNIALGAGAGAFITGSNNIDIGNAGVSAESGAIRIGTKGMHTATYIAGIRQAALVHGGAVAIGITPDGQLGVRASAARFKETVRPMAETSEAILSLKPVAFRYKKELDPKGTPQFGLVAEDVAKVNPDLVVTDDQGKPLTVRYDEVNAMLLNEFLKEHRKVEALEAQAAEQQSTNAEQQKAIEALTAAVKAQAAQFQKVSDQLRAQVPAPRVVAND